MFCNVQLFIERVPHGRNAVHCAEHPFRLRYGKMHGGSDFGKVDPLVNVIIDKIFCDDGGIFFPLPLVKLGRCDQLRQAQNTARKFGV